MEVTSNANWIALPTPKLAKWAFRVLFIGWLLLAHPCIASEQVMTIVEPNTAAITTNWSDETAAGAAVTSPAVQQTHSPLPLNHHQLYAIDGDTLEHLFAKYISNVLSSKQQQSSGLVDIQGQNHPPQMVASPREKAVIMLKGSHSQLVINGNLVQYIYNVDHSKCSLGQAHPPADSASVNGPLTVIAGSAQQGDSINPSSPTSPNLTTQQSTTATQFDTSISTVNTLETLETSPFTITSESLTTTTTMPTIRGPLGFHQTQSPPPLSSTIFVAAKFPASASTAQSADSSSAQAPLVSESNIGVQSITKEIRPAISISSDSTALLHDTRSTRHSLISINSTSALSTTTTAISLSKSAASTTTDAPTAGHLTTIIANPPASAPFTLTFAPSFPSGQASPVTESNTRSVSSSTSTSKDTKLPALSANPTTKRWHTRVSQQPLTRLTEMLISTQPATLSDQIISNRPISSAPSSTTASPSLPNRSFIPVEGGLSTNQIEDVSQSTVTVTTELSTNIIESTSSNAQPSTLFENAFEPSQSPETTLGSISPVFVSTTSSTVAAKNTTAADAATTLPLATESILENTIQVELNRSTSGIWPSPKPTFTIKIETIETSNKMLTTEAPIVISSPAVSSSETSTEQTKTASTTAVSSDDASANTRTHTAPSTTIHRKMSTTLAPVKSNSKARFSTAKNAAVPKVTRFPSPIVSWHRNHSSTPSTLSVKQTIKTTRLRPKPTTSRFSPTRFFFPQAPTSASLSSTIRNRLPGFVLPNVDEFYQLKKKFIENKKSFFNRILSIPSPPTTSTTTRRPVVFFPSFAKWIQGNFAQGR